MAEKNVPPANFVINRKLTQFSKLSKTVHHRAWIREKCAIYAPKSKTLSRHISNIPYCIAFIPFGKNINKETEKIIGIILYFSLGPDAIWFWWQNRGGRYDWNRNRRYFQFGVGVATKIALHSAALVISIESIAAMKHNKTQICVLSLGHT